MTLQFDDILAAICSEVHPSHANDHQKIYTLNTDVEAKLAYDVLIALGFDAKVYHTPGKASKLYISNPTMTVEQIEQRLTIALDYVRTLKTIKSSLDDLCHSGASPLKPAGYTIAFVNSQPNGKQILIQLSQTVSLIASDPAPSAIASAAPAAIAAASASQAAVSAAQPRIAKKTRRKERDEFASGPAVGRGLYTSKGAPEGALAKETLRKRIMLRLFGNFATSSFATLMWLVVVGVLFSCFVFAKSFVCYDFVAKKSTKWYCQDPNQISAEDARKAEQEKRQRALGLAPAEPQQ